MHVFCIFLCSYECMFLDITTSIATKLHILNVPQYAMHWTVKRWEKKAEHDDDNGNGESGRICAENTQNTFYWAEYVFSVTSLALYFMREIERHRYRDSKRTVTLFLYTLYNDGNKGKITHCINKSETRVKRNRMVYDIPNECMRVYACVCMLW